MPSFVHEGLIKLFRNRPELAPELLRHALGVELPAYTEARIDSSDMTDVQPTEYRADLVVLLTDGKPVFGIVLEVQLFLRELDRKVFTWPIYAVNLRGNLECETCVLVITPSAGVAARARRPIVLGPCGTFTPLVLGPKAVPAVLEPEQVVEDVELGVLSAMAHGKEKVGLQIATSVLEGVRKVDLPTDRTLLYLDLVHVSLGKAARRAFKKLIMANYEFQSSFGKKYGPQLFAAIEKAKEFEAKVKETEVKAKKAEAKVKETEVKAKKAEAKAKETEVKAAAKVKEAEAKARKAEAKAKKAEAVLVDGVTAARKAVAKAQSEANAKAMEAKAGSVITVLEARGVTVSDGEKALILACRDRELLDRWIFEAVSVNAVAELGLDDDEPDAQKRSLRSRSFGEARGADDLVLDS